MALIFPAPANGVEEAAQALLRDLEGAAPIAPTDAPSSYVARLLDARGREGVAPAAAVVAAALLVRFLPVRPLPRQWAVLVAVRDTPAAFWTPRLRVKLPELLAALEALHVFALSEPVPSSDTLTARARLLGDGLANAPRAGSLTLGELTAFRAGFAALRDVVA